MVDVRAAEPGDSEAMLRIHNDSLQHYGEDSYDEEVLDYLAPADAEPADIREHMFGEDRYATVAEDNDEVIGFGGVRFDDGSLLGIFVNPEYGGTGVGAEIIKNVESHARKAGCKILTVYAALNAVGFYEASGFKPVSRCNANGAEGPFGTYESGDLELPAMEMRKELTEK